MGRTDLRTGLTSLRFYYSRLLCYGPIITESEKIMPFGLFFAGGIEESTGEVVPIYIMQRHMNRLTT